MVAWGLFIQGWQVDGYSIRGANIKTGRAILTNQLVTIHGIDGLPPQLAQLWKTTTKIMGESSTFMAYFP